MAGEWHGRGMLCVNQLYWSEWAISMICLTSGHPPSSSKGNGPPIQLPLWYASPHRQVPCTSAYCSVTGTSSSSQSANHGPPCTCIFMHPPLPASSLDSQTPEDGTEMSQNISNKPSTHAAQYHRRSKTSAAVLFILMILIIHHIRVIQMKGHNEVDILPHIPNYWKVNHFSVNWPFSWEWGLLIAITILQAV